MITENLSTLKIHKLTQAQYDRELANGNIEENSLYLTPDEPIDLSIYATKEQVEKKADLSHIHTIENVDGLQTALNENKSYADTVTNSLKNDLLNGAGSAYDTLKELGDLIDDNTDAIEALETIASGKADAEHNHEIADVSGLQTALDGKSTSSHTHDDRYYTETEVDTAISNAKNTWYGTCSTSASTAAKVVTTNTGDFSLKTGNIVYVLFTYAACSGATLNVDGTGEIAIKTTGTNNVSTYQWTLNETVGFVYDGTYFRMLDGMIASTTYYGMTKLSSSTSSTSTTSAATPSAVKSAYDLANTANTAAGTAQTRADEAYDLAESKANSSHTHTASHIADLTATVTELNYMDGVTSNVQTQLDTLSDDLASKMGNTNPVGTGSFSMNRLIGSVIGDYSHTEGSENTASGGCSHAEGGGTTASGYCSHAEGEGTNASGQYSHAEGLCTTASGTCSHAQGEITKASGCCSNASGYSTTAHDYQFAIGKYNNADTTSIAGVAGVSSAESQSADETLFVVGYGTPEAAANAFRISANGKCRGVSSFAASGADFAELFEWKDGNPNNEDRRGLFVALEGEKIKLANDSDDFIGVISGAEAFLGNSASEEWQGKYLTDVFGTRLIQTIEIPEKINEATGEIIIPAHTTTQYVLNPDYNPNEQYIMREHRKEWGTVGLLGQVVVVDDGTCVVGGCVKPSLNGIGTTSNSGYRVLKRIDETHIKVLVK